MASRCSGPILNCPNPRKLHLRCLFPNTVAFSLHFPSSALSFPSISSKISLPCPGMSRTLSLLEEVLLSQTSLTFIEKKKPARIHISHSHCHSQPSYLSLFPKQTTNMYILVTHLHTNCFLIIQLEIPIIYLSYFPITVVSYCVSAYLCFFFFTYVYTWYPFIYTLLHCHWVMLGVFFFTFCEMNSYVLQNVNVRNRNIQR